ncbi:MAG: RsmE family RNA methyltransferase [Bacteroidales bacterium]
MHLFYISPDPSDRIVLDESESRHAVRVLRLRPGDAVELVDGVGGWYRGEVSVAHPKSCVIGIHERTHRPDPRSYSLHLAVSPTKNLDRLEWMLEKSTELGLSAFTPLICERTERTRINPDRLERVLVSAMKQSLQAHKPILHPATDMNSFLSLPHPGVGAIAHCSTGERRSIHELPLNQPVTFLVGPEGDFTPEEIQAAIQSGFAPYELGETRLRTETAGMFVAAALRTRHA